MPILKKSKPTALFSLNYFVAILGFLFGGIALASALLLSGMAKIQANSIDTLQDQAAYTRTQLSELSYCYNNDIHPCTSEAIQEFKKQ